MQYITANKFLLFDGGILFGVSLCLVIGDNIKMSATVNKYCESSCVSSFDCKEENSQCESDIDANMQHIVQLLQIFNVLFVCKWYATTTRRWGYLQQNEMAKMKEIRPIHIFKRRKGKMHHQRHDLVECVTVHVSVFEFY